MKNKTITAIFFLALCIGKSNAQIPVTKQAYKPLKEFKGDAAQYLIYNFRDAKDSFIGKDMSTLFNRLELKTIECLPILNNPMLITKGITLFVVDTIANLGKEKTRGKDFAISIIVKNGAPADTAFRLAQKNKRQLTCEEKKFYGNKVIADIIVQGVPIR